MGVHPRSEGPRFSGRSGQLPGPAPRRRRRTLLAVVFALVALLAAACSSSSSSTAAARASSAASNSAAAAKPTGTLVVFAATSLTDAFNKIGSQFEAANPGVTVKFNYNGSSSLATSITQGAPADVFASAAPSNMKTVTDAGDASSTPKDFATNTGEIMVEKGNPKNIQTLGPTWRSRAPSWCCVPRRCRAASSPIRCSPNAKVTVTPKSGEGRT